MDDVCLSFIDAPVIGVIHLKKSQPSISSKKASPARSNNNNNNNQKRADATAPPPPRVLTRKAPTKMKLERGETAKITVIKGRFPKKSIGNLFDEMNTARAIVAVGIRETDSSNDGEIVSSVFEDATSNKEKYDDMLTLGLEWDTNTHPELTFDAVYRVFMLSRGNLGLAVQFYDTGKALCIIVREVGNYVLVDHHDRDRLTGGEPSPNGKGGAGPIAVYSNSLTLLSRHALASYGQGPQPVRFRAHLLFEGGVQLGPAPDHGGSVDDSNGANADIVGVRSEMRGK